MTATTRVAAAVAAGYLLGRTKKLKLAITVGTVLAGGRLAGNVRPGSLIQSLSANPEVQRLQDQLRGQVLAAAKSAATNVASSRLEALNESLQSGGATRTREQADDDDERGESDESKAPRREPATAKRPTRKTATSSSAKRPARKKAASSSAGR